MLCPVCGNRMNESTNRCSRFPICGYAQVQENKDTNSYILFDLETTGFSREKDRITEIGAIKVVNGEIVDSFSHLVNPGVDENGYPIYISNRVMNLTGITNQMVADKPTETEVVPQFLEWIGDEVCFAGQNIIKFDLPFLKAAAKRAGCKFTPEYAIDVLVEAKANLDLKKYNQESLAAYFGFSYNAHRAVDDAEACYKILQSLMKVANNPIVPKRV